MATINLHIGLKLMEIKPIQGGEVGCHYERALVVYSKLFLIIISFQTFLKNLTILFKTTITSC